MKLSFSLLLATMFAAAIATADSVDLLCATQNLAAAPYNTYIINFDGGEGPALYKPVAAKVTASQLPGYGLESIPAEGVLSGCEKANVTVTGDDYYFECDGDGDAGFGTLTIASNYGVAWGSIRFPEGQKIDSHHPLPEDEEINLACRFLH